MNYRVFPTPVFAKELKRLVKKYPSLKDEFLMLVNSLTNEPIQGVNIFDNCYKIRLSIKSKGRGKSGGARVITFIVQADQEVILIAIFDKADFDNIPEHILKNRIETLLN